MARPAVDRLFQRVLEAESLGEAEDAIEALAAFDAEDESAIHEHEPVGDLYSELANEYFEEEEVDEAIRLQELALQHPCTNRRREQGTLLGYRFVGKGDPQALVDLKASRSGGVSDASLLSGFAEQAELVELNMAIRLHDEALEIAKAAKPVDEELVNGIAIGRALARGDADFPVDEDDLAAEQHLSELEREAQIAEAREARQLFIHRDDFDAARGLWPDVTGAEPDDYFDALERRWQLRPPDGPKVAPYPVDLALFAEHNATPTKLVDDLPEDLVLAIEAAGIGPITWPPGRNEPCWCGSGKKYKRCCG